ncbi:hypothetical protein BDL97_03G116400 [Sphagnum fallax]|jgi:pentatricopeptide repeat protein|nr:hypothetical protein BDL97_03G116400 [Sphagnum fallax]
MHVPVSWHLKREGVFMNRLLRVVESNVFVGNSLVDMYAKFGSIEDAWRVFSRMPMCNVVAWTAIILDHVKCGQGQQALAFYQQMYLEGVEPNPAYLVGVSIMALEEGRCVHQQIIQSGYKSDVFVGNCLIDMYAKCGSIEDAGRVFNRMAMHDVIAWSAIKCGQGHKVLELSQQMQSEGVQPDPGIFVTMLNACASVVALEEGFQVKKQISQSNSHSDIFTGSSLVDMYMPNVGSLRTLGGCSMGCLPIMLSVGMP